MKNKFYFISLLVICNTALADTVHIGVKFSFETAMSTVYKKDYKIIKELAHVKAKFPKSHILISGHTDSISTDEINDELSEARAASIKNLITTFDKNPEKYEIKIKGFGKRAPIASNDKDEGRRENRRFTVSLYKLTNQEAEDLVKRVEASKYLYILSVESEAVEEHITVLDDEKPQTDLIEYTQNNEIAEEAQIVDPQPSSGNKSAVSEKKVIDWSSFSYRGCFVGASTGFMVAPVKVTDTTQSDIGSGADDFNQDFNINGPLLSASLGCYIPLTGNKVLGIEVDYMFSQLDGKFSTPDADIFVNVDRLAYLRLKLGYTYNKLMMFGSLGLNIANVEIDALYYPEGFIGYEKQEHIGLSLAGGANYALTPKLFIQGIIGYSHFTESKYTIRDQSANQYNNAYANGQSNVIFTKLGLNYLF